MAYSPWSCHSCVDAQATCAESFAKNPTTKHANDHKHPPPSPLISPDKEALRFYAGKRLTHISLVSWWRGRCNRIHTHTHTQNKKKASEKEQMIVANRFERGEPNTSFSLSPSPRISHLPAPPPPHQRATHPYPRQSRDCVRVPLF